MRYFIFLPFVALLLFSCQERQQLSSTDPINWDKRSLKSTLKDSLHSGSTFLSIYSQVYVRTEKDRSNLTATVSLHNPNLTDSLFIDKAVYYDTHGDAIRTYFEKTIFIKPLETVQIIIDGADSVGGTGANFIFDWQKRPTASDPIFEAVMITTYGQQGISFLTEGKRIK